MLKKQYYKQRAKKVVSNSPGLVDFAIGLVIFAVLGGNSNYRRIVISPPNQKRVLRLVEMACVLVHASYSLPGQQAVKLTFIAP